MILNTSITNHQPEAPAFTGIVHKYNVKNNGLRGPIVVTTGSGEAPTVNGVSVPIGHYPHRCRGYDLLSNCNIWIGYPTQR